MNERMKNMKEMFDLILSNLQMVGAFIIPFLFMRLADIVFGVILSIKDTQLTFDYKKLLKGLAWGIMLAIGMAAITSGAVMLPALLEMYEITLVDTEALSGMINILTIIGIIVTSIVTYGKDAYQKMIKVFNLKETDIKAVKSTRIDESGEEDVRFS